MATVLIDANGKVLNSDKVAKVNKNAKEDIRWVATGGGGPWKITFDKVTPPSTYPVAVGSPFTETSYVIEHGATGGSQYGPVAGMVGWTYKYNVRHHNTENPNQNVDPPTDDPDVDVE
jgi:hypothetical protein